MVRREGHTVDAHGHAGLCPVGVTDEAVVPVPVPVPCVVGADGLDRKIARASATTETTPTIAPAVRLTGE